MQPRNFILHFIYVVWKYAYENLEKIRTESSNCDIRPKQLNIPSQCGDSHLFKHMESFGYWTK